MEIYRNSTLLGTRDVTGWPYYASGGYIGLWMSSDASDALLDDFSGGTVPGGSVHTKAKGLAMPATRPLAVVNPPPANTTWRVYYFANGKPIAVRVMPQNNNTGTLYYLHSDHLGSTSVTTCGNGTCGTVGSVVSRQRYYPYGEIRPGGTGTTPTTIGYTGQRREEAGLGSLMYYRARFYSPQLQRFLSADTIVPSAGNPQALNRFAYVYNSPLKYTDPSGHDAMLVCGWIQDCYSDPIDWKDWIMKYKGWNEDDWNSYYDRWMRPGSNRYEMMRETGIHYFRYGDLRYWATTESKEMVQALSEQMAGMDDITLVGYSKGANLIMNYIAMQDSGADLTRVDKAVLIKAPRGNRIDISSGTQPGGPFAGGTCHRNSGCKNWSVSGTGVDIINIWGPIDIVGISGPMAGAADYVSNDPMIFGGTKLGTSHGMAPGMANTVFAALAVSHDSGSGNYVFQPRTRK